MRKSGKEKPGGRPNLSVAARKRIECMRARKRIYRLLDGRLTPAKALEMKRHLAVCRRCCTRFEFMRVIKHLVRAKVLSHACPSTLAGRVRKAVSRLARSR